MILALLACASLPESIVMTASVWNAPYGTGTVVPGATVEVMDEGLVVSDTQVADEAGAFQAVVPAGVPFFVTVTAEGHVPTVFSGSAGSSDFTAPEGYPWVAPTPWIDALRAEFSACPTVNEPGGIVAGEVVADLTGYPILENGSAKLYGPDEVELTACYLDDEGASSPDATVTGVKGRFAIFGVPVGEVVVAVSNATGTDEDPVELYRFMAVEDGFVPVYPAILPVF